MGLECNPSSPVFYNVNPVMRISTYGLSYTEKAEPSKKARISPRSDFRCHLDLEHLGLITMPQTWDLYKGGGAGILFRQIPVPGRAGDDKVGLEATPS